MRDAASANSGPRRTVIDTHILLLRHSKRALTGKADARRHREGVRIIGELLKTELNEG